MIAIPSDKVCARFLISHTISGELTPQLTINCNFLIRPIDMTEEIHYSERYEDDQFEYRHVMLPSEISNLVPKNHMMTETEWRNIGIQQSTGWVHYMTHNREQHVLCFRRPKKMDDTLREINTNSLSS